MFAGYLIPRLVDGGFAVFHARTQEPHARPGLPSTPPQQRD